MATERERLFDDKSIDLTEETLTLAIGDEEEVFRLDDLSSAVIRRMALIGLSHTLGDAPSGVTKAAQLAGADRNTLAWELIDRKWRSIVSGTFTIAREGGPGRDAVALAEVTGLDVATCHGRLKDWRAAIAAEKAAKANPAGADPETRKAARAARESLAKVRSNPRFKAVMNRLQREALERKGAGLTGTDSGADLTDLLS